MSSFNKKISSFNFYKYLISKRKKKMSFSMILSVRPLQFKSSKQTMHDFLRNHLNKVTLYFSFPLEFWWRPHHSSRKCNPFWAPELLLLVLKNKLLISRLLFLYEKEYYFFKGFFRLGKKNDWMGFFPGALKVVGRSIVVIGILFSEVENSLEKKIHFRCDLLWTDWKIVK